MPPAEWRIFMKKSIVGFYVIFIVLLFLSGCNNNIKGDISQTNGTNSVVESTTENTDQSNDQDKESDIHTVSTDEVKRIVLNNENDSNKKQITLDFKADWKILEDTYSSGNKEYSFYNKQEKNIGGFTKIGRTEDGISKNGGMPNHSVIKEAYHINTNLGDGYLYVMDSDYSDESGEKVFTTIDGQKVRVTFKRI
jgi:hypothetical protein